MATRPHALTYIGPRDGAGNPLEWFGATPEREAIPARDLDADETASLSEAQWSVIQSPVGERLYAAVKASSTTPRRQSDTDAPPAND